MSREIAQGETSVPEGPLSPQEIIELKSKFQENEDLSAEVCTHIVLNMLLKGEEERAHRQAKAEASGGSVVSNISYETREDFARHVGVLSAHWCKWLERSLALPDDQWLEHMTPPAMFAAALQEMEAETAPGEEKHG